MKGMLIGAGVGCALTIGWIAANSLPAWLAFLQTLFAPFRLPGAMLAWGVVGDNEGLYSLAIVFSFIINIFVGGLIGWWIGGRNSKPAK